MKISQRVSELQTLTVGSTLGWSQFTKGQNSIKTVDGVMLLNLCTSSGDALYLYQSSRKHFTGFQSYSADAICLLKFVKGHNSVKYGVELWSLFSLHWLQMFYICTKSCRIISHGFRVTDLNSSVDPRVFTEFIKRAYFCKKCRWNYGIGRLRKSGRQKINFISLLLHEFS